LDPDMKNIDVATVMTVWVYECRW